MVLYRNLRLLLILSHLAGVMHFRLMMLRGGGKVHGSVLSLVDNRKGWIMHEGLGWVFVFPQGRRHLDVASGNRMDLGPVQRFIHFYLRNRTNAWIFLHSNDGRSIIYVIMETGYGLL